MHVRAYAYAFAYGWNLEKKIRESIFIIKLGWLINISHYAGVFVLGIPSSFYLIIKWSEMVLNVKPQTLVETFDQENKETRKKS